MRTISPALLAAQKEPSAQPYVRAVFADYHGDAARVRLQRHYTGVEATGFSAVDGAPDGSLVRARIDPATHVLYCQRVVAPGPLSSFTSWTSIATVGATGAVALAVDDTSVYLYYVDTDNRTLKQRVSTNDGASFGSASTVATGAVDVTYLAAAVSPVGDRLLIWAEAASVYTSRFSGGGWGSLTAWSHTIASITGLACRHWLDFDVVVTGTEATNDAKVWAAIYGDGVNEAADAWSTLHELTTANDGSNVTFHAPALDVLQHFRLFFVEKYAGDAAYTRLQWTTMPADVTFTNPQWREPVPFDYEDGYGVAASATHLGGALWLSSANGVWSGELPSLPDIDVSDDVVEASVAIDESGGSATVVLRNDPIGASRAYRYANYGVGALATLRRGARLELGAGYVTADGPEASSAYFWVESVEQTSGPAPRLVVRARDAWWLLERWRARRQFIWAQGSVSVGQIMQFICARAGLGLSALNSSEAIVDLLPAFTVHPGESGAAAMRRLLTMVPDVAFAQGGALRMRWPKEGDAAEYSYEAPTDSPPASHVFLAARYREQASTANRVRVLGDGAYSEAFDFDDIESSGERILQVIDINLGDSTETSARAADELRRAAVRSHRDEMRLAGVNCGQELYDVVSLTDAAADIDEAKRRVVGLSWRYQTAANGGTPRYDMTLELGLP